MKALCIGGPMHGQEIDISGPIKFDTYEQKGEHDMLIPKEYYTYALGQAGDGTMYAVYQLDLKKMNQEYGILRQ